MTPTVMDWPLYSQDLNLIENLWAILKRKIYDLHPEFLDADNREETKEKLISAAQEACNNILDEELATLSDTMSNRRDAVL